MEGYLDVPNFEQVNSDATARNRLTWLVVLLLWPVARIVHHRPQRESADASGDERATFDVSRKWTLRKGTHDDV